MSSISVVIPTYRAAGFLRATLDSVAAQTCPPAEVVVVDDRSPDDTVAVARAWAGAAPFPVRVLEMPRNSGGPAAPLNAGIEAAAGDVIATLDHDDQFRPAKLARHAECLARCPGVGLVIGRVEVRTADPGVLASMETARRALDELPRAAAGAGCYRIPARAAYQALVTHGCIGQTCTNFTFAKGVWRRVGGFDERVTAVCDYRFMQAVLRDRDVGFVDEVLCDWVQGPVTLYRASHRDLVRRDMIRVETRFDLGRLDRPARRLLRGRVREQTLGAGYAARRDGDYASALKFYLLSLARGGVSAEAALGVAKLLPHWALRRGGRS